MPNLPLTMIERQRFTELKRLAKSLKKQNRVDGQFVDFSKMKVRPEGIKLERRGGISPTKNDLTKQGSFEEDGNTNMRLKEDEDPMSS